MGFWNYKSKLGIGTGQEEITAEEKFKSREEELSELSRIPK